MPEVGSNFVSIMPSARGFGRSLDSQIGGDLDSSGKSAGKRFGATFGLAAKAGLVAGGLAVGSLLKGSYDEAREAQKVGAVTNQIIKATGGAANISAKQVGNLATAISNKAGVDDEAIQSGSNLLLTFKNVRNEVGRGNDVFNRATQAAVDLSAAGFGSIESGSKMLGKALNDPVKGVTALSRAGVTFTEQQKSQIETLTESGRTLEAQKMILKEVESQVGGTAAASATAGDRIGVAFGNFQEALGTALLPTIDLVLNKGADLLGFLTQNMAPAFSAVARFVEPMQEALAGLFSGGGGEASGLVDTFSDLAKSIQSNFLPVAESAVELFQTRILPAVTAVGSYLAANLIPVFTQVGQIIATQVVPIVASFGQFFYTTLYPAIINVATAVATRLRPVFDTIVSVIQANVLPAVSQLLAKFREHQPVIQRVIAVVVQIIGWFLKFNATVLGKVLPPLIRLAGFLVGAFARGIQLTIGNLVRVISTLVRVGSAIIDAGQKATQFLTAVKDKFNQAVTFLGRIPERAKSAIGDLGGVLFDAGSSLIQGLIDGVTSKAQSLFDKLKDITNKIPKWKGPPTRDAKLLVGNGRLIMGGLVDGIARGERDLEAQLRGITSRIAVPGPRLDLAGTYAPGTTGRGGVNFYGPVTTIDAKSMARELNDRVSMALVTADI